MPTPLGHGHIICVFPESTVRLRRLPAAIQRPLSHLVSGHFKEVFILSLPNLVLVFIGLIACMGLLLVKISL